MQAGFIAKELVEPFDEWDPHSDQAPAALPRLMCR